jgi:hypothetical protein
VVQERINAQDKVIAELNNLLAEGSGTFNIRYSTQSDSSEQTGTLALDKNGVSVRTGTLFRTVQYSAKWTSLQRIEVDYQNPLNAKLVLHSDLQLTITMSSTDERDMIVLAVRMFESEFDKQ